MPDSQKRAIWWESQIEDIARDAHSYLASRFPALGSQREDITNEMLKDLVERLNNYRSNYPDAWFQPDEPRSADVRAYLARLARTILNRRIADHFRTHVRQWAQQTSLDDVSESEVGATFEDHERRLTALRMLRICIEVIAAMSDEDRQLITFLTGDTGKRMPLSEVERQRLHRLRARLAEAIRARLGESVASLLKEG